MPLGDFSYHEAERKKPDVTWQTTSERAKNLGVSNWNLQDGVPKRRESKTLN